jgi:hypothetical protein
MDRNGRFITEAERDARVEEMKHVRLALLERLEEEQQHKLELKAELAAAHERDVREGKASPHKKVHHQHRPDKHGKEDLGDAIHAAA